MLHNFDELRGMLGKPGVADGLQKNFTILIINKNDYALPEIILIIVPLLFTFRALVMQQKYGLDYFMELMSSQWFFPPWKVNISCQETAGRWL